MKKVHLISLSILFLAVLSLLLYSSNSVSSPLEYESIKTQPAEPKTHAVGPSIARSEITQNTPVEKQTGSKKAPIETTKDIKKQKTRYVFDRENLFSSSEYKQLNHKLTQYEKKTTREIVVLTTSSISPYKNIADFALNTANEWGIGKAETNNGLFIVVSKQLKVMRITTGLGTEKVLTDKICQKVVYEQMLPEFIQGKFYTGVDKGIDKLMFYWK